MTRLQALASGAIGACTLTLLHETARQFIPHAPRVDVIGMRAIARPMRALDQEPPPRDTLYYLAMAGDLAGNALYYSFAAANDAENAWLRGAALGLAAGVGAAFLPPPLGLGKQPGQQFPATQAMTIAWYLAGGLATAAASRFFARS